MTNRLGTAGALLLAAVLAASAASVAAKAPKKAPSKAVYGAIAVNRDTRVTGYAYDFKTEQDAKREALRQCVEKQCEVVVTFHGGCAAVAGTGKRLVSATGVTRDEAETKAGHKCGKDCAVIAWACTRDR